MRTELFYWVLNAGVHGALVCALVRLLARWRRLPRRLVFWLWLGPLARLTLPFGPALPWSLMGLLKRLGARTVTLPVSFPASDLVQAANVLRAAEGYFPLRFRSDALAGLFSLCSLIWLIGATACALCMGALYAMSCRELREAEPLGEGVWRSERVLSPGLVGVLRPRILVPPGLAGRQLDWVLLHERTHRRRLDNLWRLLALAVCCLHWFNPFIWYSLKGFFSDMELACDEGVLAKLDPPGRRDYALALLGAAQGQDLFVSAFGGAKLRLRVERVLSYRRLSRGAGLVFGALTLAILMTLVFN